MRRLTIAATALLLIGTSCIGGSGDERTVFVDFSHEEFASFMIANFPNELTVHPGATVVFKQIWTGEPHTVTGGKLVDEMMENVGPWIAFFDAFDLLMGSGAELPDPENPPDIPASDFFDAIRAAPDAKLGRDALDAYAAVAEQYEELPSVAESKDWRLPKFVETVERLSEEPFEQTEIPWALDETEDGEGYVTQNAGQPCFLTKGGPPEEPEEACADDQQDQPVFDGTASYYNSGVIPYEGPQGNAFPVQLADDIAPGEYNFYCAVHGPGQRTSVTVVPVSKKIPTQEEVNREARKEVANFVKPMIGAYRDARDGKVNVFGEEIEGPFAGLTSAAHGSINEFIPKRITVKAGEPITWKLMGSDHTITLRPPEYFPIIRFAPDGEVSLNPKLQAPAGGSPKIPEHGEEGDITKIDGGTYDGEGFFSSGLFGGEPYAEYTLRFAESGTYKYACLLHPAMVGTVRVT